MSCGAAPAICPKVFELGSGDQKDRVVDEYSVELNEVVSIGIIPEELYECAKAAAEACPANAIKIEEIKE